MKREPRIVSGRGPDPLFLFLDGRGFEDFRAGDGDDTDVVLLAEELCCSSDLGGAMGSAEEFLHAFEAEEVAFGIGGFGNAVGDDDEVAGAQHEAPRELGRFEHAEGESLRGRRAFPFKK